MSQKNKKAKTPTPHRIGRYKKIYICRCWKRGCRLRGRARFQLKQKPEDYSYGQRRFASCPACSNRLSVDWYRTSGREAAIRGYCSCDGYNYCHRTQSPFCIDGTYGKAGWSSYSASTEQFHDWLQEVRENTNNPEVAHHEST